MNFDTEFNRRFWERYFFQHFYQNVLILKHQKQTDLNFDTEFEMMILGALFFSTFLSEFDHIEVPNFALFFGLWVFCFPHYFLDPILTVNVGQETQYLTSNRNKFLDTKSEIKITVFKRFKAKSHFGILRQEKFCFQELNEKTIVKKWRIHEFC